MGDAAALRDDDDAVADVVKAVVQVLGFAGGRDGDRRARTQRGADVRADSILGERREEIGINMARFEGGRPGAAVGSGGEADFGSAVQGWAAAVRRRG